MSRPSHRASVSSGVRNHLTRLLPAVAVLLTVAFAYLLTHKLVEGLALLLACAGAVLVVAERRWLGAIELQSLTGAGCVAIPFFALLGPVVALPFAPQVFGFRLALLFTLAAGVVYVILGRPRLTFMAGREALPLLLWLAWLFVGIFWAGDKASGFNYLALMVTMALLVAATAACGTTRLRLRALGIVVIIAYLLIVGFTLLEAHFGIRLPTSRYAADVIASPVDVAVTSVFRNQNDLATFIALCWPFMFCAFLFTTRARCLVVSLLCMGLGAAAFVRSGSRSSLLAMALSVVAAALLFRLSARLSTRRGKIVGVVVGLIVTVGFGVLLFNNSENVMLSEFRLQTLVQQAETGSGSGAIRTSLTERAIGLGARNLLLGVGPGQAEQVLKSWRQDYSIVRLHNWWFETYVNGGIVGFGLHLIFYVGALLALWPVARTNPDRLTRYLASSLFLALIGFSIGALGPSSSAGFAPLWIMYGMVLAVLSRSRLAAREGLGGEQAP